MFTTDPTIVDLKIRERNLYKAIFSMNFHQVATPELGVDEARCYIFFFREGDKLSSNIVLYMPNSGRRLYYSYSSNPFPIVDLPLVEDVARAFGEEMGFFLDEKSFASSSVTEKNLWIDEQPIFGFKAQEEHTEAVPTTETSAAPATAKEQPSTPAAAVERVSVIPEAPASPVSQPTTAAPVYQQAPPQPAPPMYQSIPGYYQPGPAAPTAQPTPEAPLHYQPAPAAPTAQPTPGAPLYYQPAPAAPTAQPTPGAPVYYQPAPPTPTPVTQRQPSQPIYQKEIEIESHVEVEAEVDVHPQQQGSVVQRSSQEKVKAAGAATRAERPVRANPLEMEHHAAQKKTPSVPKQQMKKETRVVGVVGRELEALARLMASF
jgi:hypothetical protein